jgi:hypothetical protein
VAAAISRLHPVKIFERAGHLLLTNAPARRGSGAIHGSSLSLDCGAVAHTSSSSLAFSSRLLVVVGRLLERRVGRWIVLYPHRGMCRGQKRIDSFALARVVAASKSKVGTRSRSFFRQMVQIAGEQQGPNFASLRSNI